MRNIKSETKKTNSKRGFYFEENNFIEHTNHSTNKDIKFSLNRVSFIFFIFLAVAFIFGTKIIYLGLKKENYLAKISKNELIFTRQDILDRNHNLLAKSVSVFSAGISPRLIHDKKRLLIKLKLLFPNIDTVKLEKKIDKGNFFYLKKRLNELERRKLRVAGHKSIILQKKQHRIYPQESLFSHVLGQVDEDNYGVSGLEKSFNDILTGANEPLILTLDSNLQHIIREELIGANKIFQTVGSAALLMEINSGEILSLVSLPDFNLNERLNIKDSIYLNKITSGVYELGSVFKTFTIAAALENKKINPDTMFNDLESKITCAGRTISEHDKLPKDLSAEQILIRSSNIGAVRIAQKVGIEKYKEFLNSLELFEKIKFEIEEVATPLPFNWGKCKLATASFGHGITTTPIQLAKAYAVLGNGGYNIDPTIIFKANKTIQKHKIVSTETSNQINSMLRKVVFNEEGTANFADIEGYEVGGKTGTAYKSIDGVYSKKKINTFVSLFPTSRPKYVLLVMLDEPKPAPNYVYELPNGYKHTGERRNTSGWNTVVVTGKIIEKIGPILAINSLQASNNF